MKKLGILILGLLIAVVFGISFAQSQSDAFISLYPNGSWDWTNGSPTPVVITSTPGASQTPWVVTATPNDILTITPTPEPFTLTPTNTPDPLCQVENQTGGGIRVRNKPSTVGTDTLGFIINGQRVRPEAYYEGPTYTWYKIWWDETVYAWTAADFYTYISGDCEGLLYENPF